MMCYMLNLRKRDQRWLGMGTDWGWPLLGLATSEGMLLSAGNIPLGCLTSPGTSSLLLVSSPHLENKTQHRKNKLKTRGSWEKRWGSISILKETGSFAPLQEAGVGCLARPGPALPQCGQGPDLGCPVTLEFKCGSLTDFLIFKECNNTAGLL